MQIAAEEASVNVRNRRSDAGGRVTQKAVRFNGVIMAANVAFDMERRISAHAIFCEVPPGEETFTFPAPFYIVMNVMGLSPGDHMVQLTQAAPWEIESQPTPFQTATGSAVLVVRADRSSVVGTGEFPLHVVIDGDEYDSGVFLVKRPAE